MNTRFVKELDTLAQDIHNIMYAINKSDNLPNFIEQHKNNNLCAYTVKRLFEKCKYVRNKYYYLFKKINNNNSNIELYTILLENMLVVLDNIYDLHSVSDITNVGIEYENQDKKNAQKKIIRIIKTKFLETGLTIINNH
tara:strand:+ start:1737 stop:2153 length:417 start_codon:yes stop_codon:yes gene_type:complete